MGDGKWGTENENGGRRKWGTFVQNVLDRKNDSN